MAGTSRNYRRLEAKKEMKTALYARISVTEDTSCVSKEGNTSTDNQVALMMGYIRDKAEFELVKTYVDTNVGGTTFERPAFEEMMEDVRSGMINCIIVKDISRFGRNYIEVGNYLETIFPLLNVRFISVNEQIDTFINGVTLSAQIKNILSDSQRKYISEATRSSLAAKARQGRLCLPNAPYGYRRESNGKFTVNEDTAKVVRQIFTLAAQGNSYAKIAKHLNDSGISTRNGKGTLWAQSTIGQIKKNRAYLGEATCTIGNEQFWQEKVYPAILTKEEFETAQHKGKSKKHMEPHISAPLVGKVICAECGRSMVRSVHDSDGKKIVSFRCRTSTVLSESSCFRGAVLETDIEASVRQRVLEYTEELRKKLTNLKDLLIEKSISLEQQDIQLKKEIETIEKHRIQALEARRMNDMSQEVFDKCCYDSAETIKKCKERMGVAEDEYKKLYAEHSRVDRTIKKYRSLLRSENFMERVSAENKIEIIIDATGGSSVKI